MRRLSLLALSLTFALPAAAEIFQWRDAQGRINYSDTPPDAQSAKKLRGGAPQPAPPAAGEAAAKTAETPTTSAKESNAAEKGDAAKTDASKAAPTKPKTIADKELEFRQRRAAAAEAEAKAEKERQRAAELARNCEQARGQLAALKSGQRMARYSSSGERQLLEGTARSTEIERTQQYIDANCR
jgi:cytoskeletal protein RodZ